VTDTCPDRPDSPGSGPIDIDSPLRVPVCRDPDDDVVLATAVAADAEAIITGDEDLLVLKTYTRVRILTPRQFLESTLGNA
jgi:uncharacterized protein